MDRDRALIRYWRNSLADVDLRSPEVREPSREAGVFPSELADILKGQLPPSLTDEIFKVAKEKQRQRSGKKWPGKKGEDEEEDPKRISILLAPFGLRRLFRHGVAVEGEARRFNPVWIPALLTLDGSLHRGDPGSPWIGREFLEPVRRDDPVVGKLDDFDRFLTEKPQVTGLTWKDVLDHTRAMVQAVLHVPLENPELQGFEALPAIGLLWTEDRGIGQAILTLYDKTLKRPEIPALLRSLAAGSAPGNRPAPAPAPYDLAESGPALRHRGQMGRFALSPSQRQTVHSLLTLPEGAVLAVNGPPGTGKTTVLQSVVASLWVNAALEENASPPVILACSTNNQAVTNILDSFQAAAVPAADDPWSERWLPRLTSYGLFLPSFSKFNDTEYRSFHRAAPGRPSWIGLPAQMEKEDYVREAEAVYLDAARRALKDPGLNSLDVAAGRLRGLLAETDRSLAGRILEAREIQNFRRRHGCAGYEAALAAIHREHAEASALVADQESLYQEILAAIESVTFWEDLLKFLPPIRERRNRRLALPYLRRHLPPPPAEELPERIQAALREARARLAAVEVWKDRETKLAGWLKGMGLPPLDEPASVLDALDLLRHRLFLIAGRYWEARWLMEIKALLGSGQNVNAQVRAACEARFRRFAMLTPCMVATFFQAPKVFDYFDREEGSSMPLFETVDLLIVDEAGQVSPEVGAATFALAKRALVVGDVHQIEPVWGIPPFVDTANLREAGLEPVREDKGEEASAFRASRGSLMSLARCATALTREDDRGLFLSEHRRCVPEVIRYCNELVYRGRLQPLRPAKESRILPALGWAHITSPAVSDGGSRCNPGEAGVIADWLARHREEIEDHYKAPLEEVAGVITPFVAQAGCLRAAFRQHKLAVRAGTVHTFQGAERQIILFSSVYSFADAPRSFFFDQGSNLLNVAVSRAKDSFLLFGDMRIFEPARDSVPSGKLARLAFAREDNEITDVVSAQHLAKKGGIRRISTLEEHRAILASALRESRERVLIVSPYLSEAAVLADDIPSAVAAASRRNVRVCVVYSRDLRPRELAAKVAGALERAGAEVRAADRMHSKTLAVDAAWLVEGSFNWLSAVRDEGHPFHRYESSICYEGQDAAALIQDAWREIVGKPTSSGEDQ